VASLLLVSWGLSTFYANQLQPMDFMSLMTAGIAAGIAAIEPDFETAESKSNA
jgi:hypothetical protein